MTAITVDAPELVAQEYALTHLGIECRILRQQGRLTVDKPEVGTYWLAHVGRAMSHLTTTLDVEVQREVSRYVVTNARFPFDPADVVATTGALERARAYCTAAAEAIATMRAHQLATWTDAEHAVDLAAAATGGDREVMR